jgi:superfamily I DNA and/or RNA helicase
VTRLQTIFPDHSPTAIWSAVDTVERFQGQQHDVIIASFGLGDPDLIRAEDEFLYNLNRFNVMASRARPN